MSAPHSDDVPRNRLAVTQADLDAIPDPAWAEVTGKPTTFPPSAHSHPVGDFTTTGTANSTTYLRGDGRWATPEDTTYAIIGRAEIEAGTAGTARAIAANRLQGAVQHWVTGSYITAISAIGQALNKAATAAEARAAIGAGTSDLAIGTTASTAKAGNWTPTWSEVQSKPTTFPPDTHSHTAASVGAVAGSGETTEVWSGTQAAYDALPTATKNALGFIAVIR